MDTSKNKLTRRDMRECLETWRKETGRTPMKRLSYMHDYATPNGTVIRVHPVVHSPRLLQSLHHCSTVKKTAVTLAAPSLSAKKPASLYPCSKHKPANGAESLRQGKENIQPLTKLKAKAQPDPLSTTKPPRREQLEKWLALHGSIVKRCSHRGKSTAAVGHMTMRTANTDSRRAPLGRTVLSRESKLTANPLQNSRKADNRDNGAYRRALKEQFQRDIDDTLAQIRSEQDCQLDFCPSDAPCVTSGDSNQLARQLDFDAESTSVPCNDREIEASTIMSTSQGQLLVDGGAGYTDRYISSSRSRSSRNAEEQMSSLSPCTAKTSYPTPTVTHKVTKATSPNSCDQKPIRDRRRSHAHFDPSLVFQSTTIKYSIALSAPRRKRRHTFVAGTPDSKEMRYLLHLTPVRRSTRKNRNGPGVALDHSMCFDSPSQATAGGCGSDSEYGGIEIVPNKALVLSETKAVNDNTSGAD